MMKEKNMSKSERFVVKWNNGYWKIFDMALYEDVQMFTLRKDAIAFTKGLNEKY